MSAKSHAILALATAFVAISATNFVHNSAAPTVAEPAPVETVTVVEEKIVTNTVVETETVNTWSQACVLWAEEIDKAVDSASTVSAQETTSAEVARQTSIYINAGDQAGIARQGVKFRDLREELTGHYTTLGEYLVYSEKLRTECMASVDNG